MVMTFWVPSLTGSSSWDALRSADPSSQPIGHFQADAAVHDQYGNIIRKLQDDAYPFLHPVGCCHVDAHWHADDDAVAGLQGQPLNVSDLGKVHAFHPVSSPYPISRPPPAATAVPAPADRARPAGSSASPPADVVIATARRGVLFTTPAVRPARAAARRPARASAVSAPCGHNANTRMAPATSAQPGPASTKTPANARQAANR